MTNKKVTRRALLMSVTSLLICISMLLGTTFAWFTDEVTSGVNQIVAGNLDVELYHNTMTNGAFTNDSAVSTSEYLFKSEASGDKMLWEPGAMAIERLTVKNVGTLAFKYKLNFSIKGYNTVGGNDLSDVIKAYVTDTAPTTRSVDGLTAAKLDAFSKEGTLTAGTAATPNTETFYVILYWEPNDNDVDNQYNLKNGLKADDGSDKLYIDLGVNLVAGQLQSEVDSFSNTYDENATYPVGINTLSSTKVTSAVTANQQTTLSSGLVKATVPENTSVNTITETITALTLEVEPSSEVENYNFTVSADTESTDYYEISMKATTDSETVNVTSTSQIVTVNLTIGEGLTNVKVYHDSDTAMAEGTGANQFQYDAASGVLTLYLNSFSPFAICYDKPVAEMNGTYYASLMDAVNDVPNNGTETTIKLLKSVVGGGIGLFNSEKTVSDVTYKKADSKNIIIDFGGYTYTAGQPNVGSVGYESQAFHLEKGNTVTLKNGTINTQTGRMLVQNYSNLTLENITLDYTGTNSSYALSNNFGNIVIKGNTNILVDAGYTAFDLWYGMSEVYNDGVTVTFDNSFTGSVQGNIEYGAQNTTENWKSKTVLTINGNGKFNGNIIESSTGALTGASIVITGGTFSDIAALDYVKDDSNVVIKLQDDITINEMVVLDGQTIDGNGHTITIGYSTGSDCAINAKKGVIRNAKIVGGSRAIGTGSSGTYKMTGNVTIDNITIDNVTYAINVGEGNGFSFKVSNSEIYGWNSGANVKFEFNNCKFGKGNTDSKVFANYYPSTIFEECKFESGFSFYGRSSSSGDLKFLNCTMNGADIPATLEGVKNCFDSPHDGDFDYLVNKCKIYVGSTLVNQNTDQASVNM